MSLLRPSAGRGKTGSIQHLNRGSPSKQFSSTKSAHAPADELRKIQQAAAGPRQCSLALVADVMAATHDALGSTALSFRDMAERLSVGPFALTANELPPPETRPFTRFAPQRRGGFCNPVLCNPVNPVDWSPSIEMLRSQLPAHYRSFPCHAVLPAVLPAGFEPATLTLEVLS
jgi:hypothetical protein